MRPYLGTLRAPFFLLLPSNELKGENKDELHRIIGDLPEPGTFAAKKFLEFLLTSAGKNLRTLSEHLADPIYDDEPLTEEEKKAIEEAEKDVGREELNHKVYVPELRAFNWFLTYRKLWDRLLVRRYFTGFVGNPRSTKISC